MAKEFLAWFIILLETLDEITMRFAY